MAASIYHVKCKNCGADIPVIAGKIDMHCEYCGSVFPVPEEMMEQASKTEEYQEAQRYRQQTDAILTEMEECFTKDRRHWKLMLIAWIVVSCILMTISSINIVSAMEELSTSFFMFGMCYIIATKPKRYHYQCFSSLDKLAEFQNYAKRWRLFFILWVAVISILFGISEYKENDLGTGVMLGGIFLLTYFRPSKRFKNMIPKSKKKN